MVGARLTQKPSILIRRALADPKKVHAIGVRLANRSILLVRERVRIAEHAQRSIVAELAKERVRWKRVEEWRAFLLSDSDLLRLTAVTNDRWGQPARSEQEVRLSSGVTPLRLIVHDGEAADAARSSDGAGDFVQ